MKLKMSKKFKQVFRSKSTFSFNDIVDLITKKWFYGKGRDEEIDEIYELFVRK